MRDKKQVRLLVIDPWANSRHGHLFDDDLFWSLNLPHHIAEFGIRSSKESINNIQTLLERKKNANKIDAKPLSIPSVKKFSLRLRLCLMSIFFNRTHYTDVLFQGFEEISSIIFMLLRPKCKVHLIVTNNLSKERFLNHPILYKTLLKIVFNLSKTIFVHSQFEFDLITKEYCINHNKIIIKPFHQIGVSWQLNPNKIKEGYILFVGPTRINRPLMPFLELIRADKNRCNKYLIAGITKSDLNDCNDILQLSNVNVKIGFLKKSDYSEIIAGAKLIVLTHNNYFEGRLSGIFCDAVASRTPVISSAISPATEFFKEYGNLGLIVDFSNNEWIKTILNENFSLNTTEYNKAVDCIKKATKAEKIAETVINAICRVE